MTSSEQPYLLAVSGGIDSMALLHMLHRQGVPLIVAHVDHGIRLDSKKDALLVEYAATHYGLPFTSVRFELGADASEDVARQARRAWLLEQKEKYRARAIITAHHSDDLLETIILNVQRGTGWRGLVSLRPVSDAFVRPLLHVPKSQVASYAIHHEIKWREDTTNDDVRYTRNYIRHGLAPKLAGKHAKKLHALHRKQLDLRAEIDRELAVLVKPGKPISRHLLIMVSESVALELLAAWLGQPLERPRLKRLLHFAKTAKIGGHMTLDKMTKIVAKRHELIVQRRQD